MICQGFKSTRNLFLRDNFFVVVSHHINQMSLNIAKCKALSFTRKMNTVTFNHQIDDIILESTKRTKGLEIH